MRQTLLTLCVSLAACGLAAAPALAQVTTNDSALQGLTPAETASPKPAPAAKSPAPSKPAATHPHATGHTAPHATSKPAKLPNVPAAPPLNLVLAPPPPNLPEHKRPPPPPVPIKQDAPGTVSELPGGNRIVFGAGSADVNPAVNDALHALAARAKSDATLQITITAWAPGTPEDPSAPRRLSLDRALAARAILINAGIASERIHAVAKGFNGIDGGPADRMDLVAAAPKTAPQGKPLPLPAATAPNPGRN